MPLGGQGRALGPQQPQRPAPRRFDPLVCWDEAGRYSGLVRIERIVDALAGAG